MTVLKIYYFKIIPEFNNEALRCWVKLDMNDIIDQNVKLSQEFIVRKLLFKSKWTAEYNILKKSCKNIVNMQRNRTIWDGKSFDLSFFVK